MATLTQPIKWHGGKHYLAQRLVDLMPPHTRYLEAFAGGLSVLLRKPCEGVAEWANDTNYELTNFWSVLRSPEAFQKFARWVQATPLSEKDFERSCDLPDTTAPQDWMTEKAYWFFIRMRQSRQGLGRDYCTPTRRTRRGMNENVSAWLSAVDGLPEIHERLRRVEVWNRPAIDAIRKLDGPDLLVYADPPYFHGARSTTGEYGEHEMSTSDHMKLLQCLGVMRGRFMLSGYDNTFYDSAKENYGWHRVDFELPNNASSKKKKDRKIESVWMNFEPKEHFKPSD